MHEEDLASRRSAFDANFHQRAVTNVVRNHVQGHLTPTKAGSKEGVLGAHVCKPPLLEDGSVSRDDSLLVNTGVGYRLQNLEFRVDVFNLLDSAADDIAYYYAARLPGEGIGGVENVHFHPLEPRTVRASVTALWGK
jgi:hypothetical protein